MKIYHVETQEDYDALNKKLKLHLDEGGWFVHKSKTVIITYNYFYPKITCLKVVKEAYPFKNIQKYKAKKSGYRAEEYVRMPKEKVAKRLNGVVNSPSHYTQGEYEVIDILQDKLTPQEFEGFLKGNILKYTFREGIKNGTEDMKKAAWYTARLIKFRGDNNDN